MRATVKSIAGESFEIDIEPSSAVADLKVKVSECWQVPAQCVKLMIGQQIMCDDRTCVSFCQDSSMDLYVTMLVSLDILCHNLTTEQVNLKTKLDSLQMLSTLGPRGGPMAIDAASTLLEHQNTNVRLAAVDAMKKLGHGDVHAIRCASALLAHKMEGVRQTAIRALSMLVDKGNVDAVEAVSAHLQTDSSPPIRGAALQALSKVANKGDKETIALVSVYLLDTDAGVRFQAVNAMSLLAHKADTGAITYVRECLADDDFHVRVAAVRALSVLAEPDQRTLASVRRMLQDDVELVRDEADKFLTEVYAAAP